MYYAEYASKTRTDILYRVYSWMAGALALTAGVSYAIAHSPIIITLAKNPTLMWVSFFAQMGLVLYLSWGIRRINYAQAIVAFLLYAALMGVTLSTIFLVYTEASIFSTFLVAAGMFGLMAIYGYTTRANLADLGSVLFMALVGLVLAGIVNIFLRSPGFDLVVSVLGVIVFSLLTAYDMQQISQLSNSLLADKETEGKVALLCALSLYLDFINLFLYLLRLMGKRRD